DAPADAAELGRLGPYRVLRQIGAGGMGVVFAAEDTRLRRLVALKLIREGHLADPECEARFQREAATLARLCHPNIVQVFDTGRPRGQPYLALEYVPGGTLAQHLQGQFLPAADAAALVVTLADAVQVAHDHGIVHRDLKPGNVLVAGGGGR